MNKRIASYCFVLTVALNSLKAQTANSFKNTCGTGVPPAQWEAKFQALSAQAKAASGAGNKVTSLYTIPVIIHVIHGGQPVGAYPNLAQGQLNSQILVWNSDYAGAGFNSGNYPLAAFSDWALNQNLQPASLDSSGRVKIASCNVQFCLATLDTLGNALPEPGIDRVNYLTKGWANPANFTSVSNFQSFMDGTVKPQTIWNVTNYLNLWITDVNINSVGLLGYSTFPPLSGLTGLTALGNSYLGTSTSDGVWCYSKAFGSMTTYSTGTYFPGYTYGRTSSHEVGHWLGLRHIWGDGNCTATDYCDDTPPASASNFGSPTYPLKANVCSSNWPDGEMFMNLMDYSNDVSKYMVTVDQAARVQTAMSNSPYRMYMGNANLCSVGNVAAQASFTSVSTICTGVGLHLANSSYGFPPPSYTWTSTGGAAVFAPSSSVMSPSVTFSSPGTYVISLSANNNTQSIYSKTISVTNPPIYLSATDQTICAGSSVTLSASGVNSYTWEPGDVESPTLIDSPGQSQIYTCKGSLYNGCTTTGTLSLDVSICTGIKTASANNMNLKVYPNPANEAVYVTTTGYYSNSISMEITDALGKSITAGQLSFSKETPQKQIDTSMLKSGIYLLKLIAANGYQQVIKLVKE